jgi:sulfite oxidase
VLIVKGKGIKKHKFTLHDLKTKFKKYEVTSTLQCAGNRREDLHSDEHRVFIAPHWVVGAMSNAKWGGVRIRDVLEYCGLDVDGMALGKVENPHIKHVQFEGYDTDETGLCYGGSIPIDKAVDGLGDCIFAFEMNGQELSRDHGYPVRVIAPGHAGARQLKWLHKVILSDQESQTSWQQKSYRSFAPDIKFETDLCHWPPARLDQAPIVQELPVQSLVCHPPQNAVIGAHGATGITLNGVAWSGGGRKIERVDVSIDGGKNWTGRERCKNRVKRWLTSKSHAYTLFPLSLPYAAADLYKPIEQKRNRHWAWTQFSKTVQLPPEIQEKLNKGERVQLDVVSKAMNSDFNVQPERMEPYWNARGVGINHWYHVNTVLDPALNKGELVKGKDTGAAAAQEYGNTPSGGRFVEKWGMHGWTTDAEHRTDPLTAQKTKSVRTTGQ